MKFSTRTRYALRLMVELALAEKDEFIALKDVSRKQEISIKYLEQIVPHLTRAGLVASSRGSQGGYRLTRRPSQYTAGEIIRAVEGNPVPVACLEHSPNACRRAKHCATLKFWTGLQNTIDSYLNNITLENLSHTNDGCS